MDGELSQVTGRVRHGSIHVADGRRSGEICTIVCDEAERSEDVEDDCSLFPGPTCFA